MGKSKTRNAFYFFMLDFKQKPGYRSANMKELAELANPFWTKMSAEARKPYEEKAKADKGSNDEKYTSTGVKISTVQRQENEKLKKHQQMKDYIENTILGAKAVDRIADERFYFIHANSYGYCNTNKKFIPCEIAVTRFTLKMGVIPENVYHSLINPGPLPQGYAYQARKLAGESHQLEHNDEADSNLSQVASEFMSFMHEFLRGKAALPPLYVDDNNKLCVESIVKQLCCYAGVDEDYMKIYSLEELFFTLRNAVGDQEQLVYPSIPLCKMELEKDKYDFCKDIPCDYHINSDVPYHCSRSRVIRLAYIICDNCCSDLEIDLIPGQHVPSDAKIVPRRPHNAASSSSNVPTVKETSSKIPSHRNPRSNDYFLSQRTESEMSAMSETSSVYDDGADYADFNDEASQAESEWIQPRRHKRHEKVPTGADNLSQASSTRAGPKHPADGAWGLSNLSLRKEASQNSTSSNLPDLNFITPSGDEDGVQTTFSRRPIKLSAVLTGGISSSSLSPGIGPYNYVVGRGRGRGFAVNYPKQMP